MPSASPRHSRVVSLRAPITSEEERAVFQKRLALVNLLLFSLASFFWLVALAVVFALAPSQVSYLWSRSTSQVQLATTAVCLLTWLGTRAAPRTATVLSAIDAGSTVAVCVGWALMTGLEVSDFRPELTGALACAYTLVLRAALIPSAPLRTGAIGLVAAIPLVLVTYRHGTSGAVTDHYALPPFLYVGIWSTLGAAATAAVSWVIYGLRQEVRRAMALGQYVLEDKIGEGGMGVVYRARHALLRRPTAIKLLSGATAQAVERFEREVQITASLTHPNTVVVFDYGRTPDNVFYYAMEFLDGVSLEDLVHRHGPQDPARVVHILLQVCGALREAHAAGLVHRDIKPANVMLTSRGGIFDAVKVLDFGLVREAGNVSQGDNLTGAQVILGTPHYMSPEAITDAHEIDGRVDLYALGATAFYLLTGRTVFEGRNVLDVCGKQVHEAPPAPSSIAAGVSPALDAIILSCLAKERDARPKTAAELATRLQALGLTWSDDDARSFWEKHPPQRQGAARAAHGMTIAVDVAGRR